MITAQNIGFTSSDGRTLFSELTFTFSRQKTGLVGKNGVGKTTLLRILAGEVQSTTGTLVRTGKIGYLPQNFSFDSQVTIADVFGVVEQLKTLQKLHAGELSGEDLENVEDWTLEERLKAQLDRMELGHLAFDRKALSISGGELTRLALAAILWDEPEFLLLDEPTNNLDRESRTILYNFIQSWNKGLLIVSHDRELLMLMDQIFELTSLGLNIYGGNFLEYQRQKELEDAAIARQVKDAQKTVDKAACETQRARERQQRRDKAGRKKRVQGGQLNSLLARRI